jgi:hypothetical protein
MSKFAESMMKFFESKYLRAPNVEDIARLLAMDEQRVVTKDAWERIVAMHLTWKNILQWLSPRTCCFGTTGLVCLTPSDTMSC